MVTLGEVLSLATPRGITWLPSRVGKFSLLSVSRSLENEFAAIVHLKILSNTGVHTKPQPKSPCSFMQIFLYIVLLTRNYIPSKTAFP